jgi:hypothetical protein
LFNNLQQQHQLQTIPAQRQFFNNLKQQHQLQPIPEQQQLFNNLQRPATASDSAHSCTTTDQLQPIPAQKAT